MKNNTKLSPIHPGRILTNQFMIPLELSQNKLAKKLRVPVPRINAIVNGERAITPETALRLARFFRTSPEFWLNLQQRFDLQKAQDLMAEDDLAQIDPIKIAA